jgi:hypothetical protein
MQNIEHPEAAEPGKVRSSRRAFLFALLACVVVLPLAANYAAPLLERAGGPIWAWLVLPPIVAFPVLYRSRLLSGLRKESRAGLVLLVSYAVFAIAFVIWVVLILALMLISGASIG